MKLVSAIPVDWQDEISSANENDRSKKKTPVKSTKSIDSILKLSEWVMTRIQAASRRIKLSPPISPNISALSISCLEQSKDFKTTKSVTEGINALTINFQTKLWIPNVTGNA